MIIKHVGHRAARFLGLALVVGTLAACGGNEGPAVVAEQEADAFLYQQGARALERGRWLTAREYFQRLVETYPTSQHRQDAKLGIGDSYIGEKRVESDLLAVNEFREFLRFFPLAPQADYAQYRLAVAVIHQTLSPDRDQTATIDALRELAVFRSTYPSSKYMAEVVRLEREMRDKLSESEFLVGRHYFRSRWYTGAVTRLEALIKADPSYTGRDGVYFFLGEAYNKQNKPAEARSFYQKVIDEYRQSEYLEDAAKRLAALPATAPASAATPAPGGGSTTPPPAVPAASPATPPPSGPTVSASPR
jgi:outer membrane protein assembly factor BamD